MHTDASRWLGISRSSGLGRLVERTRIVLWSVVIRKWSWFSLRIRPGWVIPKKSRSSSGGFGGIGVTPGSVRAEACAMLAPIYPSLEPAPEAPETADTAGEGP